MIMMMMMLLYLDYGSLLMFGDAPVPIPVSPGDYPAIATPEMRLKMTSSSIFPAALKLGIPNTIVKGDQFAVGTRMSVLGIATVSTPQGYLPLGRYVLHNLQGDVNQLFQVGKHSNQRGIIEERTPTGGDNLRWMERLGITTTGPFMPSNSHLNASQMVDSVRLIDKHYVKSPFVVSGNKFSMNPTSPVGNITMKMKMFEDKYVLVMEALRRPELSSVWRDGLDLLLYVENTVLKVNGAASNTSAPYCWDWVNPMSTSPATRFVIFGWFTAHGLMHLLETPINVSMPSIPAGTVLKGKK
jgi:hypothetical protein